VRRLYVRIAAEFLDGYWSTATAGPFLNAFQRDTGMNMGEVRSFVGSRATIIRNQIQGFLETPFRIRTNGGEEISTAATTVDLDGEAPVNVTGILYRRNAGDPADLTPAWVTPTRWRATFELPSANNNFQFFGFDAAGSLTESTSIRITTSAWPTGFIRGDANGDRVVDISDSVAGLLHLFGGLELDCQDAADFDDNGHVEITDAIAALNYLFRDGAPPAPPYPFSGMDPSPDQLDCDL
jgi:hypothetical protein